MKNYESKMLSVHQIDVSSLTVHDRWHEFFAKYFSDWWESDTFIEIPIPPVDICDVRLIGNLDPPFFPEDNSIDMDVLLSGLLPLGAACNGDQVVIDTLSSSNQLEVGFISFSGVLAGDFNGKIRSCYLSSKLSFEQFFLDPTISKERPYDYYSCDEN